MPSAFLELASILTVATICGIIAKALKQPLILAYIFTGVVISILGFFSGVDTSILDLLSNLGVAFLLFLIGVELQLSDLKYVGRAALLTGVGQIIFTAFVGFVLISTLGFSQISSLYMALAVTFSSTVIIIKLIGEKHDLQSLYGKIAVGYLLVQDFVAVVALMFLSAFGQGTAPDIWLVFGIFLKGLILLGFVYLASRTLLKWLFKLTSSSVELLFVSAIAWAFVVSALGALFGFSVAIGAFLAGVAIASSPYRIQISARIRPLRDFFIILFFIILGASLSIGQAQVLVSHVLILSLFILLGKPLLMFAIMLTLGFRNRTAFLASITGAQISEFSLIILASGAALGHVQTEAVSLLAAVGIATMALSSYLILYGDKIYKRVEKHLTRVFPETHHDPYVANREILSGHVILVGAEQMGSDILKFLKGKIRDKNQIVVVDFNPEIIDTLRASGFNAVFGDIADPEVLEQLEFGRAQLVVITDPDIGDNEHLIKFAKEKNFRGPIIGTSYWVHDAVKLYEAGADYVVVPEEVGGDHVAKILSEHWEHLDKIKKRRSKNFEELMSHKVF